MAGDSREQSGIVRPRPAVAPLVPAREASYPSPLRRPSPPGSRPCPAGERRRRAPPPPHAYPYRHRTRTSMGASREIRSTTPGALIALDISPLAMCACELVAKSIPVWRFVRDAVLDLW